MSTDAGAANIDISGIEVSALVREFSPQLIGSYVSNIYSLDETQVLKLKRGEEERTLVISPKLGAWLTTKLKEHATTTPFTTSLRGEIARCKLENVGQVDLDRVFVFTFSCGGTGRKLILELMPPGNVLVLDEQEKVVIALREVRSAQRRIVRGERYREPLQARVSPDAVDAAKLRAMFEKEEKAGRALGRGISLPRKYVDEILDRSSLSQQSAPPRDEGGIAEVEGNIKAILQELKNPHPCVVRAGERVNLMAIKPTKGEVLREGASLSELIDEYFVPVILHEIREEGGKETAGRKKEFEVTLAKLKKDNEELLSKAARARECAVPIKSMPDVKDALSSVKGIEKILPVELYRSIEREASAAAIASSLFDFAKQLESESKRVLEASAALTKRMGRESRLISREEALVVDRQRKREWYEKFRWFFTSENKLAVGGRDAQSNSLLIKRHLEEQDVVYHADLFGSPFFVLKGGRQQSEAEIKEVARATVSFSSGWKTGLGSADAYWVFINQVSSTAPSGEYLARGSFAIRGKKNFVTNNLIQISIGLDERGRIISGPEEAIVKQAKVYLTLIPFKEKASDTARKVIAELKKLAGDELARGLVADDVIRMLPAGGGKILRRVSLITERKGNEEMQAG